jgi:geranylgeranyl reductase family protein
VVNVHDTVVVGAGPGGSATAHYLAQRGLDVVLLDKFNFPRDKTCGDGLTPRALRILDDMGILHDVTRLGCQIGSFEVVAPNGHTTSARITGDNGALVIPRMTLDDLILRRAVTSGAQFEYGVNVSRIEQASRGVRVHAADGRSFDCRTAVVATGAATAVLRASGVLRKQPRAMLAARAYFEGLRAEIAGSLQLRFDGAPLPGYGWIFPVASHTANIGVGFLPRRHSGRTGSQAFSRFVAGKAMQPLLDGARQVSPLKGYPIRVDFLTAPTFAERTLLVGEAAGLVNPLTGEGIDYALESGKIAAEFLAPRLDADGGTGDLAEYNSLLHNRFEKLFRFTERVRDWYCLPPLLNTLVLLANHRPDLRQLLANIVLGEQEPRGYGPLTMLGRLFIHLLTTRRPPHD